MAKASIVVEFDATMKAILREDKLDLSLTISVPYGRRKVSVSSEEFSPEIQTKLSEILKAAQAEALQTTLNRGMAAASQAATVASQRMEKL